MASSLYLINPKSEAPSYFGAEAVAHWGFPAAQSIADLVTATVAGLVPDDWDISICDEYVQEIDFASRARFIGLTGKITQESRLLAVADEFRRRGKTVIIGGPLASLSPERLRDHCDILVIGELEGIAGEFFADLDRGQWQSEYVGDKPDLSLSPPPRWDLYPNDRTIMGCVQTSRGCPFECEFCDVIQYLGRQQRHKPIAHIIAECDQLYELGYRSIFLADDNLTAYRKRAKAILAALGEWNMRRTDGPVSFGTQVSIDAAKDAELMALLGDSGMTWVFIGIETPNVESLKESKKRQNVGVDLLGQVQVFLDHGVSVTGGMIVGFDHDGHDIFQRQYEFAMASPIPIFSLGALVAPAATPLYDRMQASGRLLEDGTEVAATPWDTNIVPTLLTREELISGLRWLCNSLYQPATVAQRIEQMIDRLGPMRGPFAADSGLAAAASRRRIDQEVIAMMKKLMLSGREERRMWTRVESAMAAKPGSEVAVMNSLFGYAQVRCLYDVGSFWEPHITQGSWQDTLAVGSPGRADGSDSLVQIGRTQA